MKTRGNGSPGNGKDAVTYAELLGMAHEAGLKSIQTQLIVTPNDENGRLAIVKATVEIEVGHFEGIGDADPQSVEAFLVPHLIRVAEDRAKARALRDAVNIGVISFEEPDGEDLPATGESDLRSGVPDFRARSLAPRENGFSDQPSGGERNGNGSDAPMSDAQRRYLFRLLAGQGYKGKAAEEYLSAELDGRSMAQVTRAQASQLIEQLVQSAPARGAGNGVRH